MDAIKKAFNVIFFIPIILINNFVQYKKLAEVKQVQYSYIKWILCIISIPSMFAIYIFLVLLRQFVSFVLLFKHKSKFGGILKHQDVGFTLEYPERMIIDSIFLIEADKSPQEFHEMIKERINEALKSKLAFNPKIRGTLHMFYGYPYILRDQVTIDECITKLKRVPGETITKEDLLKINEETYSELLPKNNKGFWKVLIGSQPIDWDENSNKSDLKVYPVKLRICHSVGDGIHIYKGLFASFGDKDNDILKQTTPKQEPLSNIVIFFLNLFNNISNILSFVSMMLVNSVLIASTPPDILHGKKLIGKKFMCIDREESSNHFEIAKNIKNRFSDVALSDVLATAFSASLTEYYQKHANPIPKYINCGQTRGPGAISLINARSSNWAKNKIVCKNDLGISLPKLPTFVETKHDHIDLKRMLKNNAHQTKQIHKSGESEACRFIMNTLNPNVPITIFRLFAASFDMHAMITNIPGPSLLKVMDGHLLKNVIFWSPNVNTTGIGLAINTYGGKLQMSLNVDAALVPEREQVQKILDNTYKYIELLDEATSKD